MDCHDLRDKVSHVFDSLYIYIYTHTLVPAVTGCSLIASQYVSQVLSACDRIGSYKYVGWCQSRHLLDVIFENNREAAAALIDIEVSV